MDNNLRKRRKNRRNRRAAIIVALIVLLLAGLATGAIKLFNSCKVSALKRSLPFGADAKYSYTGDGFLYLNGKKLNFYSLEDEKKSFSLDTENANGNVIGSKKLKAVYGASSIQMIGTPFDNTIEGGIIKLECGSKYLGAYVENADNSKSLIVYNSAGAQCYRTDFSDTTLIDFGFAGDNSSIMYMCELVTMGSSVSTTITTYDLSRESKTGLMFIQGQVVKNVIMTDKSLFAFCTNDLIRFDLATNEEAYRILCRGYECISSSLSGGRLILMLSRSDALSSPVRLLSVSEGEDALDKFVEITQSENAVNTFQLKNHCVIAKSNELLVYSLAKGDIVARIAFDGEITSAEKLDDNNILVILGNDVLLYHMKNI